MITTADIFVFSQITFLRKVYGSRLNVFAPVNDLSTLSGETRALTAGQSNDVAIAGGQILGDEYSDHVIKVCVFILSLESRAQLRLVYRIERVSFSEKGLLLRTSLRKPLLISSLI